MSSLFCAICPHDLHFDSELNDLAKWAIGEITNVYWEHGDRFKGFSRRLTFDGPYRHSIEFFKDPDTVCIRIDTPHAFSISLYPYGAVFTTLFKGFMIGEDEREFIHDFREELYQLMRIIGSTEAIFLSQNNPALDMVEEGYPYSKAKEWLLERHGPAISDYSAASLRQLQMKSQPWFLDTFEDLKAQYGPGPVDDQHEAWYDL